MSKHARTLEPIFRDRANLLIAASRAAESLERRCEAACGPIVTLSRDELLEVSEQFQRVTALLSVVHLSEAQRRERGEAA